MDVQELKNFFKEHLVPNKLYHIGKGSKSGRLCLRCDKGGFWEVFFGEKRVFFKWSAWNCHECVNRYLADF